MTSDSPFSLAGRRALVTGSSRGIGAALAYGLAEAGADVAVHYTGARGPAEEVASRIVALGRRSAALQMDLGEPDAATRLLAAASSAVGPLDILVSNVAIDLPTDWLDVSQEQFDRIVGVNFRSAFELLQQATPPMIGRRWGRLLTIGSVQEARPHPRMVVYAALKSAQANLVRNLGKQLGPHGVTINNLAPGVILTDRNTDRLVDPAYREKVRGNIPVGTFGEPKDCVGAALLLCSDAGRYITGQTLFVDGGMSL
jgi:NAD(P)-dependent dehydrogenase (short-subunit alcohol dehydrogenase family)